MKRVNLRVPAMQSEHCQNRVKNSVEHLGEIKITSLKPGSLEVEVPEEHMLKYVYTAVQSAGYEIMSAETTTDVKNEREVFRFKSNINCMGCVNAVAPSLNEQPGIEGWQVDLKTSDKILTVESSGISKDEIMALVQSKGYKAEVL